ncbi:MAG: DUF2752 domain-containing protein [Bacteroidota bacterium]|nr:DUF2752 domain-containing protein [Bacteroidota bacterium]
MRILFKRYFELSFWLSSLFLLAFMNPGTDPHYSFCLLKLIGIKICPGCGLGHSIHYLLHGDFSRSFAAHPLGSFALIVILRRIIKLAQSCFSKSINNPYAIRKQLNTC